MRILNRSLLLCLAAAGPIGAQPRLASDSLGRLLASADSAWDRGARDSAAFTYRVAVARDSGISTRALFRLARFEAEQDRLDPAIALLRSYVRREPADEAGKVELARVMSWRGWYAQSLAAYDDILRANANSREASLGRAQVLAWASRFPEAVAAYQGWLAHAPGDTAAHLDLARTWSWWGKLDLAARRYAALAQGGSREAARGLARVTGWQGDLRAAEQLWRSLVAQDSTDTESLVGLAQVQRWSGASRDANVTLGRVLRVAPSHREAVEQRRWVRADLSAAAEPVVSYGSDSDGNRMTFATATWVAPSIGPFRMRVIASGREASLAAQQGRSLGGRASLGVASRGGRVSAAMEGGAVRLTSAGGALGDVSHTRPWLLARATASPTPWLVIGGSSGVTPFDETAPLIASGITTTGADAEVSVTLPRRLALGMGGGWARVNDGTVPNARRSGSAALRWTPQPAWTLSLAGRAMAWDTTGRADGYFAPNRFAFGEASVRRTFGRNTRWDGTAVDVGLGRQHLRFSPTADMTGTGASRVAVTMRFSPLPGAWIEGALGASSVASPFADEAAEYSYRWLALRARLLLF